MRQSVLRKKYAPFYVALMVTGLVMALLFLRPDEVVGLSLSVDQPPINDRNSQNGFKLLDSATGRPEIVVFGASVQFDGGNKIVTAASLDIVQSTGDQRFSDVIALTLPVEEITSGDLTSLLPASGDGNQGTLLVDVIFTDVSVFPIDGGFGYGYNGLGNSNGLIKYILYYTPPPFIGDYTATVTAAISGQDPISTSTDFNILAPLTAVALPTLYPTSDVEALVGDLVILQVDVSAELRHIVTVDGTPQVTVSGEGVPESRSMIEAAKFHPALREKWGVDSNADFLLPLKVPDVVPGRLNPTVTAEAIDGVPFTTSATADPPNSPIVEVVSTRSKFNVYLMPGFSFVSTPLQCASPPRCSLALYRGYP